MVGAWCLHCSQPDVTSGCGTGCRLPACPTPRTSLAAQSLINAILQLFLLTRLRCYARALPLQDAPLPPPPPPSPPPSPPPPPPDAAFWGSATATIASPLKDPVLGVIWGPPNNVVPVRRVLNRRLHPAGTRVPWLPPQLSAQAPLVRCRCRSPRCALCLASTLSWTPPPGPPRQVELHGKACSSLCMLSLTALSPCLLL